MTFPVPPHINIWAETKKFVFGDSVHLSTASPSPPGRLTDSEVYWLAQAVSDWLNLPITVKISKNDVNYFRCIEALYRDSAPRDEVDRNLVSKLGLKTRTW